MYNINLVRYALTNQCGDSVIYKTRKIIEHYLEVIQDGELLYRFNDKEEACGHLTELIIMKSVNDVPSLGNNDRDLIKLVLENKTLFDENSNALGDIKEKAKSFKYTIFEFDTIEDYKAALEDFVMNDNVDADVMSDDETLYLDKISEMLDDEFDALCDMEQRGEMLNGKELPTKPKYAIAERALGLDATDWNLMESSMTYSDLGTAIDFKPNNYVKGLCRNQFEVVNLSDPNWKQSLIENDDEEYFIMKREVIRSGTDATDWAIDSDIFETWSEANSNIPKDYGNFQFIIASRPKEKEEKKVDTRRRVFNFGD